MLGVIVYIALLVAVYAWIYQRTERQLNGLILFLSLFAAGLLVVGLALRSIPTMDLIHFHIEVINMLNTRRITNIGYFEVYPFQQNETFFLYFLFKIFSFFGGTDLRLCGILLNVLVIWIFAVFLYCIVLEEKGKQPAVFVLFTLVTMPNFYLYSAYYYTDTISPPLLKRIFGDYLLFQQISKGRTDFS